MSSPLLLTAYDVIICGGGTAGCVLAARLSEDPNLQVLMLEAGEDANDDPRVTTPGLFTALLDDPTRDWMYKSEPNAGLNGRVVAHARGKCIGGSSAINVMALIYPSKTGLDIWAELGNPGWDWQSMAPYFRKFQTHVPPSSEVKEALGISYLDSEFIGKTGPISASFPQSLDPIQQAWVDSWKTFSRTGNPVDGIGNGGFTSPSAVNVTTGERSFAGNEYYKPAKNRSNLHTVTGALVEKVVLEPSAKGKVKATGVIFSIGQDKYTAHASREVVLSAGTFGSSQILELSGVGSSKLCESVGIKCVIDNPNIGENLQDHLMCGPSYEVKDGVKTIDMLVRDPKASALAMDQYQATHKGPMAGGGGYSFAYTPLVDFITPNPKHELQSILDKYLPESNSPTFEAENPRHAFIRRIIESPDETSASMLLVATQVHFPLVESKDRFIASEPGNYITIATQLSHPFSRGSSHIVSADPNQHPVITTNYLSHPLDADILGRHILQCQAVAETAPMQALLKPGGVRLPRDQPLETLEDAIAFGRANASCQYHPSGTCAMLPVEKGGVVNERLVVHGTTNLRVVDASVFPIEPRGNIMSTVYATAEKGADLIKEDLKVARVGQGS